MPAPANLVHETSTSTGTGNLTVAAVNGKQRLSTAFSTGAPTNVFDYFILNRDAAEYERGTGHMSDANTLVRDTVIESTNANAAVNFSAGAKDITNDVPAGKQIYDGRYTTLAGYGITDAQAYSAALASMASGVASFAVHKNGTDQTGVASATYTQITFGTEAYDVGGCFASNAWTPPAGKVTMSLGFYATGTMTLGATVTVNIYKNGSLLYNGVWPSGTNQASGFLAADDIANGTDVYTAYAYVTLTSGTATISGNRANTFWTGHWIGP